MSIKNKVVWNRENFFSSARKAISEIGSAVRSTMGPRGGTVVIGQEYGDPLCTKDGARVIRNLDYGADPLKQIVLRMMRQACETTDTLGGDGTTTTCVLFEHLAIGALKAVESGRDPRKLVDGIKAAKEAMLKHLKSMTRPYGSQEELFAVATLAANGDKEIGEVVSKALIEVGKNGMVTVEEGKATKPLDCQHTEGMCIDRSFASPYFATSDRLVAELDNPYIMISANKITTVCQILPVLEFITSNEGGRGRPLVIIAEDYDAEVLNVLLYNKYKGTIKVCPIKPPGFGDRRLELLEDIAIATGGLVIASETGVVPERNNFELIQQILGEASRTIVTKDKTTLTFKKDGSTKAQIVARVASLKERLAKESGTYEQEKLSERIAKLDGGVAVIHVGGTSEVEMKERKDCTDDALYAAIGARDEGVVPGGGASLIYLSKKLKDMRPVDLGLRADDEDEEAGVKLACETLKEPIRVIIENGEEGGAARAIVKELLESGNDSKTYDAREKKIVDALKSGIVDPSKVVRLAISNSFAMVCMLMNIRSAISDSVKVDCKSDVAKAGKYGMDDMDY